MLARIISPLLKKGSKNYGLAEVLGKFPNPPRIELFSTLLKFPTPDKEIRLSLSVFRIDIISQRSLLVRSFFAIQTMINFMTCYGRQAGKNTLCLATSTTSWSLPAAPGTPSVTV